MKNITNKLDCSKLTSEEVTLIFMHITSKSSMVKNV